MSFISTVTCPICGEERTVKRHISVAKNSLCKKCCYKREYWSEEKRLAYENRSSRPKTIGKKHVTKLGYIRIHTEDGWKYEHHYVWEQNFGAIPKGFVVHHKDGIKTNNDPSNLELMAKKDHDSLGSIVQWDMRNHGNLPPVFKPNKKNIPINKILESLKETKSIRRTAETFDTTKGTIIRILKENNVSFHFDRKTHTTEINPD